MKYVYLLVFSCSCWLTQAQTALFNNRGADMYVMPGAYMIVKADSLHNHTGSIQNAGDIVVEGNIYNDATLTGGSSTPTGLYQIHGDWINNGVVNSYNDSVQLAGGAQFIGGTQPTPFHHLILAGTPGSVKTQLVDASVDGVLNLSDHELATENNEMLVLNTAPSAIVKGTGPNGFVSSLGAGRLTRATASTSPYLFPLGTPSAIAGKPFYYRPVEMKPAGAAANRFGGRLVHEPLADSYDPESFEDALCKVNPLFYHRLYHSSGADAASIKVFFDKANDGAWSDLAQWRSEWKYMPVASVASAGGFSTVEVKNWTNFSTFPFALASKKFVVDAGADQEILPGATANLDPVITISDATIQWIPSTYLDFDNIARARSTPSESLEYTLQVTNAVGCKASDQVKITILPDALLVPTGFSPNGDGANDLMRPLNTNLDEVEFQVFNRWGEKVFETTNTADGWDGTYKGVKQDLGVYVWKAVYRLTGSSERRSASGNFTLVK
ncbi:MAG: gliding motility-associated C-terminal domain-containing protein [Chitinophagales bacterium]